MNNFLNDESGAVTVDWVVLTAALVGLGLAVMAVVSNGVGNQANAMDEQLSDGSIIRVAFTGNSISASSAACSAAGVSCAGMDAGALAGLSGAAFTNEVNSWNAAGNQTAADATSQLQGAGLSFDSDSGQWGNVDNTDPANPIFTADSSATETFNQAVANDSYSAALADEAAARTN